MSDKAMCVARVGRPYLATYWCEKKCFSSLTSADNAVENTKGLLEEAATKFRVPVVQRLLRWSLTKNIRRQVARMAVPLPLIQLVARLASDVIARYVAEVCVNFFRRAGCAEDDPQDIVSETTESARVEQESMQLCSAALSLRRCAPLRRCVPQAKKPGSPRSEMQCGGCPAGA